MLQAELDYKMNLDQFLRQEFQKDQISLLQLMGCDSLSEWSLEWEIKQVIKRPILT